MMKDEKIETLEGVRTLFERNLPDWVRRAAESPDAEAFRRKVVEALPDGPPGGNVEAALRRMAGCEGQTVRELSRDEDVRLETLSLLWKFLSGRLGDGEVHGVMLATNPDVEGETTATYLARVIRPLGVRTSRLASGLPVGGDLEYADEITLGRAIEERREV